MEFNLSFLLHLLHLLLLPFLKTPISGPCESNVQTVPEMRDEIRSRQHSLDAHSFIHQSHDTTRHDTTRYVGRAVLVDIWSRLQRNAISISYHESAPCRSLARVQTVKRRAWIVSASSHTDCATRRLSRFSARERTWNVDGVARVYVLAYKSWTVVLLCVLRMRMAYGVCVHSCLPIYSI
jgi:hypothetical protein